MCRSFLPFVAMVCARVEPRRNPGGNGRGGMDGSEFEAKQTAKAGRQRRLGLRHVRDLEPGGVVHDPSLPGFGARRRQGTAVTYFVLYYTAEGRRRRFTIGQH